MRFETKPSPVYAWRWGGGIEEAANVVGAVVHDRNLTVERWTITISNSLLVIGEWRVNTHLRISFADYNDVTLEPEDYLVYDGSRDTFLACTDGELRLRYREVDG